MYGKHCRPAVVIALMLIIVGALNWGLVGLGWLVGNGADWNVVHMLLGQWMQVEAVVYLLVGLAGIYKLVLCMGCCKSGCGCGSSCDCGAKKPGM